MGIRKPRNTSKDRFVLPLFGGDGNQVLQQEAEGQKSFVESTTLPTRISDKDKRILEASGVVFGDEVEGDPLFQYATLPEGWEKRATDHSMHSDVVDDKGRKRAGIFYKAAFYDRSASLALNRRYGYKHDYEKAEKDGVYIASVTDCGEVIHTTPAVTPTGQEESWDTRGRAGKLAAKWLDDHYPDWENAGAYWEE